MPVVDFCAFETFPLRPESLLGSLISHKAVSPRWCSEIGHHAASSATQRQPSPSSLLGFLWPLKESICKSLCHVWLVRCSEKGVMNAEVSTGVRILRFAPVLI